MPVNRIELCGLDGSNLLAFMAALGTLRVLSAGSEEDVRLSWSDGRGWWMPALHHGKLASEEDVITELSEKLALPSPAFMIGDDLGFTPDEYRKFTTRAALEVPANRAFADFISAFGSDSCSDRSGEMQTTALRAIGGGQQRFLSFYAETSRTDGRRSPQENAISGLGLLR